MLHRRHKQSTRPGITLNVTSMVDILFNLLVYFIVTANFSIDEGSLKAKLPSNIDSPAHQETPESGNKYTLELDSTRDHYGCDLRFNHQAVPTFSDLGATLEASNHGKHPASGRIDPQFDTIVIKPGESVRWQHVVNAFNQATRSGYGKVAFGGPR